MSKSISLLLGCAALLTPLSASAQTPDDPSAVARFHVGGLALDPRFRIENFGVDTNVFNTSVAPQKDLTASLGPELDAWLHAGRVLFTSQSKIGWTYFRKATKQRSVDYGQTGRMDVSLAALTPYVSAGLERTRQRPNLEIDARVRLKTDEAAAGVRMKMGTRVYFNVEEHQRTLDFGDDEFGDVLLANSLNRTERSTKVDATVELTPLTSLVIRTAWQRDRFESHLRDSDSLKIVPGLVFKPLALLSGEAFVGFRDFNPQTAGLPPYTGLVSAVNLTYVARDFLRITTKVDRDVDYSFDPLTPYYVSTGAGVTATQAIGTTWDIIGRLQRTQLGYRANALASPGAAAALARTDFIVEIGAGVGRHLNDRVRIGVDVDHSQRNSNVIAREYAGYRIGGSFSYGY